MLFGVPSNRRVTFFKGWPMKRPFMKPATTYSQQVALPEQLGIIIEDPPEAEFYLPHLNYYRFGAYWLPFEANQATHQIELQTRFSDILNSGKRRSKRYKRNNF